MIDRSRNELHPWRPPGVFPCNRAPNRGSEKLWRSRSPQPWSAGRLKRVDWWISGRLRLRPMGGRPGRCSGLQTQVGKDLLDHGLFEDRRDDLQAAAAVRAMLDVDLKYAPEQFGPAQTRWAVMHTERLTFGWRCGLRGLFGFLRHHQRAQLCAGCENAVVRAAGVRSLRKAKLRGHQTNQGMRPANTS